MHIKTPVRSVRRGILVKHLGTLSVSEEWIDKIAASDAKFSPAIIGQACKIASLTGETNSASLERVMERALQNSLEVMGLPRELKIPHFSPVTQYSLDFLNPSQNLVAVTEGLKQRPAARLCFYGPPGSGKTAFAHYCSTNLMDSLDQAVLRRFDFKIKFGFLTPDQRWKMFLRSLEKLSCPIKDEVLMMIFQQRLEQLSNLTPGDFATVIRQTRVLGKAYTCEEFLSELENECKVKTGAGTQVKGFVG